MTFPTKRSSTEKKSPTFAVCNNLHIFAHILTLKTKVMKKVLISIAAMLACVGMNAQLMLGGGLELSSESYEETDKDNTNTFEISPFVGYQLNDNLIVGAEASFSTVKNLGIVAPDYGYTTISIKPFAMYKLWNSDMISFYGKASFSYSKETDKWTQHTTDALGDPIEKKMTEESSYFGFGLAPVLEFAMTDHMSLFSEFGYIGFNNDKDYSSTLSLSVSGSLYFGLIYRF